METPTPEKIQWAIMGIDKTSEFAEKARSNCRAYCDLRNQLEYTRTIAMVEDLEARKLMLELLRKLAASEERIVKLGDDFLSVQNGLKGIRSHLS